METQKRKLIDEIAENSRDLILSSKDFSNERLEDALEAAGIDVKFFLDKDIDGFLKWDSKQKTPVIAVNANQSPTRQKFSMAHELGHLIIDWNWIPYSENSKNRFNESKVLNVTLYRGANYSAEEKKEETIVNEFAAAFLMPDSLLQKIVQKLKAGESSYSEAVDELSRKTDVSVMAASYRLKNYCKLKGIEINE